MALSQAHAPELKRFTFFVSRRLEDGRERFRLHMGYFESLQSAEEWLNVVREVYPGAWAGEAPGKRLAAQAAAESAAAESPASKAGSSSAPSKPGASMSKPSASTSSSAPSAPSTARSSSAPSKPAAHLVRLAPTLKPAGQSSAAAVAPRQPARAPAPPARAGAGSGAAAARARAGAASAAGKTPQSAHPVESRAAAPRSSAAPAATAQRSAQQSGTQHSVAQQSSGPQQSGMKRGAAASASLSNVREVLAALDETGATRQMPAAVETRKAESPQGEPSLSDSQVLKVLEERTPEDTRPLEVNGIALLKPDDTGTRQAIKQAVASNAPVSFAVQLQWAVQPIDASAVPPLAIFSAYTLYTVEGSRQGRRWYGLRLGFFGDAISAKQVAHYVRSEFTSVAVVPVSPQERERASAREKAGPATKSSTERAQLKDKITQETSEFKLFDDSQKLAVRNAQPAEPAPAAKAEIAATGESAKAAQPAIRKPQPGAAPRAGASYPGKRAVVRSAPGRVGARERRSPRTLEETLEILGADELEIDQGRGVVLKDRASHQKKAEVRKNSPFTKLLERLADRARKGD